MVNWAGFGTRAIARSGLLTGRTPHAGAPGTTFPQPGQDLPLTPEASRLYLIYSMLTNQSSSITTNQYAES